MWLSFLFVFGVLVVAGALLLGWGIPFLLLFFLLFAGLAAFFVINRGKRESVTDEESEPVPGRAAEPSPPELAPRPGAPDPDRAT